MEKKGIEFKIFFWAFHLAFLIIIAATLFNVIDNQADGTTFDKKFLARDVALMLETTYLSNYPVEIDYALTKENYELKIEKEEETTYVKVGEIKEELGFTKYPLVTTEQGVGTELFGEGVGLSQLHITSSGSINAPISIQEGAAINISSALPEEVKNTLGILAFPVETPTPTITSCFGGRFEAITNTESIADKECSVAGEVHCGIDVRGRNKERALAVTDGVVERVLFGKNNWGTIIIRSKNNPQVKFKYLHLDSACPKVLGQEGNCTKVGAEVTKGQPIGIVGNKAPAWYDGIPIGPHLDLKLIYQNTYYDTIPLFENLNQISFKQGSNCDANKEEYSYKEQIERRIVP